MGILFVYSVSGRLGGVFVEILHPREARVQDDRRTLSVSKLVRGEKEEQDEREERILPLPKPQRMGRPPSVPIR